MCWISNKAIKQIAKEDIPVFKIVKQCSWLKQDDCLLSLFENFKYKEGETYTADIVIREIEYPNEVDYEISEGLHSYSPDCRIIVGLDYDDKRHAVVVPKNDNLVLSGFIIYSDITIIKVNCIIPKGAEYYVNENGEYVSNMIKICNKDKIIE